MKKERAQTVAEERAEHALSTIGTVLSRAGINFDQAQEEAALKRMFERVGRGDMLDQLIRD